MLTQDMLDGLAFPLIKVRFIGAGMNSRGGIMNADGVASKQYARWTARYGGSRITRPYNDSIESGARNALPVAQELWERVMGVGDTINDYILIPVDIDSATYGFVPMNKYVINGKRGFSNE